MYFIPTHSDEFAVTPNVVTACFHLSDHSTGTMEMQNCVNKHLSKPENQDEK